MRLAVTLISIRALCERRSGMRRALGEHEYQLSEGIAYTRAPADIAQR
jgi:hypothetical protein